MGLECLYSEGKPDWMDGETKQKEMMEKIKAKIKQSAIGRRERRIVNSSTQNFVIISGCDFEDDSHHITDSQSSQNILAATPTLPDAQADGTTEGSLAHAFYSGSTSASVVGSNTASWYDTDTPFGSDTAPTTNDDPMPSSPAAPGFPTVNFDDEAETTFTMMYLDFVFPFLFPHYRPSVIDCGRHWVLDVLKRNTAVFHASISLTAYFFSLKLDATPPGRSHARCKTLVWDQLMKQTDKAIQTTASDIENIRRQGAGASLVESVRAMESIIQVLIFEVAVKKTLDWNMHLEPALALFSDILTRHMEGLSQPGLDGILNNLGRPSWAAMNFINPAPSTPAQSAFRFFAGLLLFIDIISSTALEQPPRLRAFHDNLLGGSHSSQYGPIELDTIVGCQNWVLVAIGDIAALDAWKKAATRSGTLSVVDLVRRSESISQVLDHGLSQLGAVRTTPSRTFYNTEEEYYGIVEHEGAFQSLHLNNTRVWVLAATIYLSIVVSGWQPSNHAVRDSVLQALVLFRGLPSAAHLRALAWPLWVVGCLASVEQEQEFRDLIIGAGELRVLGTLGEVLRTVEAVWQRRQALEGQVWDLTKCLRIFGLLSLFI